MARGSSGRLISRRMLAGLSNFFPAEVTMQAATATQDEFGAETLTWADLAGLDELHGQLAAGSEEKLKRLGLVVEQTTHVLGLQGCFRAISPAMRAIVDGTPYEVRGVRHDSQLVITYLALRRVVASDGDLTP